MKIAVTGASGHTGINLCRELVSKGHKVRALIHKNTESLKDIPLDRVQGDLKDIDSLSALVQNTDIVFHLGAIISIRGNRTDELFEINVEGTRKILDAAQKASVTRFFHFSSIHALVHTPYNQVLDESRLLAVEDRMSYSRSKALAEEIVLDAAKNGPVLFCVRKRTALHPGFPAHTPHKSQKYISQKGRTGIGIQAPALRGNP
jgi:dihydroflavonol-4-reductase